MIKKIHYTVHDRLIFDSPKIPQSNRPPPPLGNRKLPDKKK
jgi:hypothetical protein